MVDARLRGAWLTAPAHDGLSDAAYRIFHNALMHAAEQGTDGAIMSREIRFLYPSTVPESVLEEIERAGFWERTDDGFQFIDWAGDLGQSTAASITESREKAKARARRSREKRSSVPASDRTDAPRDDDPTEGVESVRDDPSRCESRRTLGVTNGARRQGKARQGKARQGRRAFP